MSLGASTIAFSPLIAWPFLAALGVAALLLLGLGAWRSARGLAWRSLASALLLLILANPSLVEERREAQKDIAVIVVDNSPSQRIGERRQTTEAALAQLQERLGRYKDLEVRVVRAGQRKAGGGPIADTGTELFAALGQAMSDVPRQRLAGAVMITDGQVHDVPPEGQRNLGAPLHVLLSGKKDEGDRRLTIVQAPSFGLVDKQAEMTIRVDDLGPEPRSPGASAHVILRQDGGPPQPLTLPVGQDFRLPVTLAHGGPNIFELEAEAGPHELTLENNRAAASINGVRDRLRVLLVTGEPHAGERTWRNLLKADPSVDLVHFTILRPPEKQDGTPIRELSLIAFPIRELFDVKLSEFDLIIFDRYRRRGVLPNTYLDNVARYVENGGALLEAAGPNFGTPLSLYRTPLGSVLPAEPTGRIIEKGFKPRISEAGERHPVTAGLPGDVPAPAAPATSDPTPEPRWGRWFRHIEATPHRGTTVMTGADALPLLVLDRVGKGRVAQLLSDEMWLWTRGFEGGGPQAELLRRLAYWLMQEPDLEENDLRATIEGDQLLIRRQSLEPDPHPVRVTFPDGRMQEVALKPEEAGRSTAALTIAESGLYRVTDGTRTALAAAGAINPIEMSDVRTTAEKLAPVVAATGGGTFWLVSGTMPDVRRVAPGRDAAGHGWMGLRENGDYVVTGLSEVPLMPAVAALVLAAGALLGAWRREGR